MAFNADALGDDPGCVKFDAVPLIVVDGQRKDAEPLFLGQTGTNHRIKSTGQKHNGGRLHRIFDLGDHRTLASRAPGSLQWSLVQLSEKSGVSARTATEPAPFSLEVEGKPVFDALCFKLHQARILETYLRMAVA